MLVVIYSPTMKVNRSLMKMRMTVAMDSRRKARLAQLASLLALYTKAGLLAAS